MTAQQVLTALSAIRAPQTQDEYDLHGLAADALQRAEIDFRHEAPLAPRCRIDFLCGDVGIEIKRGRPDVNAVSRQLRRYADSGKLRTIILLSEKTAPNLPGYVAGIPVYPVSLQKLWGIAIGVGEEESVSDDMKAETEKTASSPSDHADVNQAPFTVIPSEAKGSHSQSATEEGDPSTSLRMTIGEPDTSLAAVYPAHHEYISATEHDKTDHALEDRILRDISNEDVPPFLRDGEPASYYYGTLSYNARRKCWVIKGDPGVTELAKRLFPGSDAKRNRAGEAPVPRQRRQARRSPVHRPPAHHRGRELADAALSFASGGTGQRALAAGAEPGPGLLPGTGKSQNPDHGPPALPRRVQRPASSLPAAGIKLAAADAPGLAGG